MRLLSAGPGPTQLAFGGRRSRASKLVLIAWAIASFGTSAAQDAARVPLNSERIEAVFGSYGIEVLKSGPRLRVSNLYSVHDGQRITRTFAIVEYPAVIEPAFAKEHAEILAGGSIGAVFAAGGWRVSKHNRAFASLPITPRLARMIASPVASALAVHVYVLDVEKNGVQYEYAEIAEVHHPDYLTLGDVQRIYGPLPAMTPEQIERTSRLLAITKLELSD